MRLKQNLDPPHLKQNTAALLRTPEAFFFLTNHLLHQGTLATMQQSQSLSKKAKIIIIKKTNPEMTQILEKSIFQTQITPY